MKIQEIIATSMPKKKSQTDGTIYSAEDRFYQAWEEDMRIRKAQEAERIRNNSNLGVRFSRRTFDTFDKERDPNAYERCIEYCDTYKDSERNSLLIIGGVGTGKTHLMASIANRLLDNGIPVLFDTFDGHLYKLKAEFDTRSEPRYLKRMQRIDVLMLDDIGKEKQTEWSQSIMFQVVNQRYENMLPIVMTSNLKTTELAEYFGSAVWSRLCEMCVGVTTSGKDYRRDRD